MTQNRAFSTTDRELSALGARDAARQIHRATKPSKHQKDRARRDHMIIGYMPVSGNTDAVKGDR